MPQKQYVLTFQRTLLAFFRSEDTFSIGYTLHDCSICCKSICLRSSIKTFRDRRDSEGKFFKISTQSNFQNARFVMVVTV